jgi:hypothetical protein
MVAKTTSVKKGFHRMPDGTIMKDSAHSTDGPGPFKAIKVFHYCSNSVLLTSIRYTLMI